ncbi:MAG: DUF669 domain-containing protein, partial [Planctomycetota bacterium]|nr:DUF669 domain-containing protein [Planctomycetota bacterium]
MGVPLDFTVRYPNTNSGSGPIENGKYLARIISTERQEIRGGAGDCLLAVFEIAGGKYRGRRVFARYGLWHHDANMREIAHNVFSALCRALGLREVTNSQQLHDIPLYITIQTRQSSQDSKKIYENIVLAVHPGNLRTIGLRALPLLIGHQRAAFVPPLNDPLMT